ncbi:MAG: hypothetical protein HZC11_09305 [Nitrospirae bacterium]|nr:hypothetical protein [Nitrospirota bacterium]
MVPFTTGVFVELIYNPDPDLPSVLRFYPGDIFIALLNDIPFIILAFFIKHSCHNLKTPQKTAIACAGVLSVSLNLIINIDVWKGIVLHLPGSSTAAIVYIFLPIYGIIAMMVGYGVGWLIGKIILMMKNT